MAIKCKCGNLTDALPFVCRKCGNGDISTYTRVPDEIDPKKKTAEKKELERLKKR